MELKRYSKNKWLDTWLVNKDERKIIQKGDNKVDITIPEENYIRKGTVVSERRMNNIEDGIDITNFYTIQATNKNKEQDLYIRALWLMNMTGAKGGGVINTMDNIEDIEIDRGIYDSDNAEIYCQNNKGDRYSVKGFGAIFM